jgi:hypothetical protein
LTARPTIAARMRPYASALFCIFAGLLPPGVAHALDKVDPYICPTQLQGSGYDCFLEAIPQTYTMCRHIKSIEIIEFGMTGAQEGVNGAKTESCIDKHRLSITRPYQAALREASNNKDEVQGLRKLYDTWLDSLAKLKPVSGESEDGYKLRVVNAYGEFNDQIKNIRAMAEHPPVAAAKPKPAPKKKAAQP